MQNSSVENNQPALQQTDVRRRAGYCYCHTCDKNFHALGIARHRAMHRDKRQDCEITFSYGDTYRYRYAAR